MEKDLNRFKFRWFDTKAKQMYNIESLDIKNDYATVLYKYADEYIPLDEIAISDGILMQCTSLQDKSNTLIYEGDILKIPSNYTFGFGVQFVWISYKDGCWGFRSSELFFEFREDLKLECFEIIGNIYENEELLKSL